MPELEVEVSVTPPQIAAYYRGQVRAVIARASNGQTVQFPLSVLHKFISADGIHGRFRLIFDAQNKFERLEPLG